MLYEPLQPPRFTPGMNVGDAMELVSEGNPGALSVLISVAKLNPELSMEMLLAADRTGFSGALIWQLYKDYAGTATRAAALLCLCAWTGLPTPQELKREVEEAYRTGEGPTPLLERALTMMPTLNPLFAEVDLSPPRKEKEA